jgi:hypothetical protein
MHAQGEVGTETSRRSNRRAEGVGMGAVMRRGGTHVARKQSEEQGGRREAGMNAVARHKAARTRQGSERSNRRAQEEGMDGVMKAQQHTRGREAGIEA